MLYNFFHVPLIVQRNVVDTVAAPAGTSRGLQDLIATQFIAQNTTLQVSAS